ncbi:MAG: ABC transporter ATP-binding protein [Hoeflea sp.]|uniref:ABC transporter ATP-binding protein n=1 Tax=Hoeflea sp. TaxID=1940281 RepID=UPI001D27680C|nr:ABC transporter ATP-binding protein [Hoeflea sp.]MBU4528335.1 ABC transporter ATP-binding protein [Alphaproteobacteria bacterium]MBU4543004.1 ABC transporter ATP-binding protein [Alphaproteobacteria bacterium]MBU4551695.1 ABC transporter ATP-binding protein [Alphaproteobacteria bacterium]MBV1723590.1 ABC transporter ATP-binding protein [Hoeflea sp.]MBV1761906.1 ABC transporter ATP-binding protein [Hoeflea sp.]
MSKVFGSGSNAFKALDNVSVDIRENEFFTLLGPSGCGKTTLLRLIAGFEQPTSGEVLLDGEDLSAKPPYQRPVNTVFQNYALFPHMTVAENISFGLEMLGRPKDQIKSVTANMLRLVQLEAMADRRITQISGGQQQRVALARALAPQPKVLLLDEPLSALDLQLRKEMQLELKRLQTDTGITFVFVTHDQDEALTMSDRIAVMNGGKILQIGTPREIYDKPQHRFVAGFIGEINLVPVEAMGAHDYAIAGVGSLRSDEASVVPKGDHAVLAIRPERIALSAPGPGKLPGVVTNVVYHGTDTIFHIRLADGLELRARSQNNTARIQSFAKGDQIGWTVDAASVSVLADDPS